MWISDSAAPVPEYRAFTCLKRWRGIEGSASLGRWHPDTVRRISRNQMLVAGAALPAAKWWWPVLVAQGLWGLVALRHGAGLAWLRGRLRGRAEISWRTHAGRSSQRYWIESETSEHLLEKLQCRHWMGQLLEVVFLLHQRCGKVTHADIGIVIVTYNSGERDRRVPGRGDARPARKSWWWIMRRRTARLRRSRRRGVRLIANSENRGFAAAVNQGFVVLNRPMFCC